MTLAFVTQPAHPAITPDDQLAAGILANRGHTVRGIPWDAPDVDWSSFDAVILRSTWDYHHRGPEFLAWLDHLAAVQAPVHNPAPILKWNAHKRYLLDLQSRGIPIVPTTLLPRGARPNLSDLLNGHPRAVLKPAFAAGAANTWTTSRDQAASDEPLLHALLDRTDVLLQPFLPQIADAGEWSLIFFNHTFSHAVLKRPKPGDFRVQQEHGGSAAPVPDPPPSLIDQARRVLHAASPHKPLLYARVDGVLLGNTLALMELEALEPFLFLSTSPRAADNFATAILQAIRPR